MVPQHMVNDAECREWYLHPPLSPVPNACCLSPICPLHFSQPAAAAEHPVADDVNAPPSSSCAVRFTGRLLSLLWSTLLQLDDLTASTGTVMNLISDLYQHMPPSCTLVVQATSPDEEWDGKGEALGFETLIPRLYPFFRHNIQSGTMLLLRSADTSALPCFGVT